LEISDYQAAIIRRMYRLLVDDQLSTRAIARKLTQDGVATAMGAAQWQPTAVFRMLTNPAYKGSYRYRQSGQEEILIPVPPRGGRGHLAGGPIPVGGKFTILQPQ